ATARGQGRDPRPAALLRRPAAPLRGASAPACVAEDQRAAARARARAASTSRSRGGAFVTSSSRSRREASATSSTARSNAAAFAAVHTLHLCRAASAATRDMRLVEVEELRDVGDALLAVLRRDPVLLVVHQLLRTAAVGLVERELDRLGLLVGVHQHLAVDVP